MSDETVRTVVIVRAPGAALCDAWCRECGAEIAERASRDGCREWAGAHECPEQDD